MRSTIAIWTALLLATALVGCGGSSGGSGAKKGVFIDSEVGGIGYRTETTEGKVTRNGRKTNAAGQYDYSPGEVVIFHIGDLEFPAVPAKGVVTPVDIAEAAEAAGGGVDAETVTLNILRLLQTLDTDGDPSNGITISPDSDDDFADLGLDVTSATFEAEVEASVTGLVLIHEADAERHVANQLIGSWVYNEGAGKRNILTFIDEQRYIILHEHSDGEDQVAGSAEFGTYTWDIAASELSIAVEGQSDGSGGLDDGQVTNMLRLALSGDTLRLKDIDDAEGADAEFIRIKSASNPLVGGYVFVERGSSHSGAIDSISVLTFLSGSEYAVVHSNNSESNGQGVVPVSGEFGSYSIAANELSIQGASVNLDGAGGLYGEMQSNTHYLERLDSGAVLIDFNGEEPVFSPVGIRRVEMKDALGDTKVKGILHDGTSPSLVIEGNAYELMFAQAQEGEEGVFDPTAGTEMTTLYLNADGTGQIEFAAAGGADTGENVIAWSVRSSGALQVTETDVFGDQWFWEFTPTVEDAGGHNFLIRLTTPEGQQDAADMRYTVRVQDAVES